MSNEHPLLQRAQKYPHPQLDPAPPGCTYDPAIGAWRLNATGTLWVDSSSRDDPRTKKHDIETGEDQKGE